MIKKKGFIIREVISGGLDHVGEIRIDESPFLNILAKIQLENNTKIDCIIKGPLKGPDIIEIDNIKYHFYMSTTSQMKKNEAMYVRSDARRDVEMVEHILSTGKIREFKENKTEMNINKDIIGRLSLAHTGSYKTSIIPDMIVVPDLKFTVKEDIRVFEDGKLEDKDGFDIVQDAFDGAGIASEDMFRRIGKELEMDHVPSWVTIRSKMATKGLLSSVKFQEYFQDQYKHDTDCFKKVWDDFYIKDCWGKWNKIKSNSIIIPQSMVKWNNWYSSMEDYEAKQDPEYASITDCLYIAKIGKEKAKETTQLSYQLLSSLALTTNNLHELTKDKVEFYHKVMDFEKVSVLRLVNLEIENGGPGKDIADKIALLLSIDFDRFIKMTWIKRNIIMLIERKIKEISVGGAEIRGNFKVCVPDTIAYLDSIMYGKVIPNLKKNELYVPGEIGVRTCARFPIASPYEVSNEVLVDNKMLDKYCNFTNDMVVINQDSIFAVLKSGLDFDGDQLQMLENEIIQDAVLKPMRPFVNVADLNRKNMKQEYSFENRKSCNKEFGGNLIGSVANMTTTILDRCSEMGFVTEEDQVVTYGELYKELESKELVNEKIKTLRRLKDMPEQFIRSHIRSKVEEKEHEINSLVVAGMTVIDSPKTGIKININELKKEIKVGSKMPYFFYRLPDKSYSNDKCNNIQSPISLLCSYCEKTLYKRWQGIENSCNKFRNNNILESVAEDGMYIENSIDAEDAYNEICELYKFLQEQSKIRNAMDVQEDNFTLEERYNEIEKYKIYKNSLLSCDISSGEIRSKYSKEVMTKAISKFILSKKTYGDKFALDFFFREVVGLLELANETQSFVEKTIEDGVEVYKVVQREIKKDLTFKIDKKQDKLLRNKFKNAVLVNSSLINPMIEIVDHIEIKGMNLIQDGNVIGKLYGESLVKAGIELSQIQGIIQVDKFMKSPSGKSCKILIK